MNNVEPIRDKKKLEKMKVFLHNNNLRDYALFVLGINSGLRVSDLLNLRVKDVFTEGKVRDRIALHEKKTGKLKDFPIGTTAAKALKEYLAQRTPADEEVLFPSRNGAGPLSRAQAWRIMNIAARVAGIKGEIGTHSMRKTFGYWAYKKGVDLSIIQQLLNHSSPAVTLRYIGITQDQLDQVYLDLAL